MTDPGALRRRQLGAFLRARRESLPSPESAAGRRRTPGLRREEVAERCGISTTWYTWIEQGRDIAVSAPALDRLARALRLTEAERAYLFGLARRRDPAPPAMSGGSAVPAELLAVLRTLVAPAYLMDRLWTLLGWNEAAGRLFSPWLDSGEPCLLRYVFLEPSARIFIDDWEERARRLVAEFRADTARLPGDPALERLVVDLARHSTVFSRAWSDQTVSAREGGIRTFRHPQDGALRYQQVTLLPATHPGSKLVVLLPPAG